MKEATELEYLEYFFEAADFGPAHTDVVDLIEQAFVEETGKHVPKDYRVNPDYYLSEGNEE